MIVYRHALPCLPANDCGWRLYSYGGHATVGGHISAVLAGASDKAGSYPRPAHPHLPFPPIRSPLRPRDPYSPPSPQNLAVLARKLGNINTMAMRHRDMSVRCKRAIADLDGARRQLFIAEVGGWGWLEVDVWGVEGWSGGRQRRTETEL